MTSGELPWAAPIIDDVGCFVSCFVSAVRGGSAAVGGIHETQASSCAHSSSAAESAAAQVLELLRILRAARNNGTLKVRRKICNEFHVLFVDCHHPSTHTPMYPRPPYIFNAFNQDSIFCVLKSVLCNGGSRCVLLWRGCPASF